MRWPFAVLALLIGLGVTARPAPANASAQQYCQPNQTEDHLRPLPPALVPQAEQAFGLHGMAPAQVQKTTVMRCMQGELFACNYGANLPCGKANTSPSLPAGLAWCQQKPDADFIPAYISGHDSIYNWRCKNGAPVAQRPAEKVDERGFITRYWKLLQ